MSITRNGRNGATSFDGNDRRDSIISMMRRDVLDEFENILVPTRLASGRGYKAFVNVYLKALNTWLYDNMGYDTGREVVAYLKATPYRTLLIPDVAAARDVRRMFSDIVDPVAASTGVGATDPTRLMWLTAICVNHAINGSDGSRGTWVSLAGDDKVRLANEISNFAGWTRAVPYQTAVAYLDQLIAHHQEGYDLPSGAIFALTDIDGAPVIGPATLLGAENSTAEMLLRRLAAPVSGVTDHDNDEDNLTPEDIRSMVDDYVTMRRDLDDNTDFDLDDGQRAAVVSAVTHNVSVITGGPGTGKTTVSDCVAWILWRLTGRTPVLTSFTGKAMHHLVETISNKGSVPMKPGDGNNRGRAWCGTMHSLVARGAVEQLPQETSSDNGFDLGDRPVIIDETTMIAQNILGQFMTLCPRAHIIFLGDVDQLPSISPGQCFTDLIGSGVVPVSRLTVNHRSGGGIIEQASKAIVATPKTPGAQPVVATDNVDRLTPETINDDGEHFYWPEAMRTGVFTETDRSDIALVDYAVDAINADKAAGNGGRGVVVLSPIKNSTTGTGSERHENPEKKLSTVRLNTMIQTRINPDGREINTRYGLTLKVGDRAVVTKNNSEFDLFNGMVGTMVDSHTLLTDTGEEVFIPAEAISTVEPAYAMTIHKSQGSEYNTVILAMPTSVATQAAMFGGESFGNSQLLYTAVTRAKKTVAVFGAYATYAVCCQNTVSARPTRLARLLRGEISSDLTVAGRNKPGSGISVGGPGSDDPSDYDE